MLNVGGGELLIIFLVALVVLGPTKLPEAARQAGKVYNEFKKISTGFQREFRDAMKDPVGDAVRDVTAEADLKAMGSAADPYANAEKTTVTGDPTDSADRTDRKEPPDPDTAPEADQKSNEVTEDQLDDEPPMSSDR